MADVTGYIWYKGFVSRRQLMVDGIAIKDLPTQSDMHSGRLWIRPGNEADLVKPSSLVDSLNGRRFPYGGAQFKWPLVNMSPKMVQYVHRDWFDYNWYADLTVQTFNRASGDWESYWVTARWPDYSSEAELSAGGYNNFQINFINAIAAPEGASLTINGQSSGNFTVGASGKFTLSVSNVGDSSTFSSITLDYTLPDEFFYQTYTSGDGWTVYWSTDGVTYNDILLNPASGSQVRYMRWIYEDVLDIDSDTTDVSITVRPDVGGAISSLFAVSSTSDADESDNELEFLAIVQSSPFPSGFDLGFGLSDRGFDAGFEHPPFGVPLEAFSEGFSNGWGANAT